MCQNTWYKTLLILFMEIRWKWIVNQVKIALNFYMKVNGILFKNSLIRLYISIDILCYQMWKKVILMMYWESHWVSQKGISGECLDLRAISGGLLSIIELSCIWWLGWYSNITHHIIDLCSAKITFAGGISLLTPCCPSAPGGHFCYNISGSILPSIYQWIPIIIHITTTIKWNINLG